MVLLQYYLANCVFYPSALGHVCAPGSRVIPAGPGAGSNEFAQPCVCSRHTPLSLDMSHQRLIHSLSDPAPCSSFCFCSWGLWAVTAQWRDVNSICAGFVLLGSSSCGQGGFHVEHKCHLVDRERINLQQQITICEAALSYKYSPKLLKCWGVINLMLL